MASPSLLRAPQQLCRQQARPGAPRRAPAAPPRRCGPCTALSGDGNEAATAGSGGPGSGVGGGGGGGGDGGGAPEPTPPPPAPRWRLLLGWLAKAFACYLALLLGAATLYDALLAVRLPQLDTSAATVSVIIPALNEGALIASTVRHVLADLQPPPCEVVVVDGGSTDGTAAAAAAAGARVVRGAGRGRARQMNGGARAAKGELLLFLHADTQLPDDAVSAVRGALACPATVLVGFRPLIVDKGAPLGLSTANNLLKTWYGPILFRPLGYVRGLRVLFGDQAMTVRARDLAAVGGFREALPIMEDAELCLDLHAAGPAVKPPGYMGRGRVRMLLRHTAETSGRRIAAWGELRANALFARISMMWVAGASPEQLYDVYARCYADVR